MKKIVLFVTLVGVIASCSKSSNNNNSNNNNTNNNTVAGQYGTPFAGVPAAKDIVMYEVNMRAFSVDDNFAGVEARLDSIKALGVNVIWLMPIYPIGQLRSINSPYCVQDDTMVNSEFGTLSDLRTFVSMAHNLGMAVILDWVTDGTSWDNGWISDTSWYVTSGGQITALYSDVAELNYNGNSSGAMEALQIAGMKFWLLQANVDGFRCDNAGHEPSTFWTTAINSISTLNHKLILLAEDASTNTAEYASGFQMTYGWSYFNTLENVFGPTNGSVTLLENQNTTDNSYTSGYPSTYVLRFTSNHDKDANDQNGDGTPDTLFGGPDASPAGAMAAFVLTATMGGVPLIYDGQEVGCNIFLNFFGTSTLINWSQNTYISGEYEQVIGFRNANEAVKTGTITYLGSGNNNVCVFEKTVAGDTALVIVNVRHTSETYTTDAALVNTTWTNVTSSNAPYTLPSSIALNPYQYILLQKQ